MLNKLLNTLEGYNAVLVAVSKTHSPEKILKIYDQGHRIFGENRVQELTQKYDKLPKDIEWHLIGHLQRNKVKYITPFVSLIHSVDSFKLLKEINKQAGKNERIIDCLLQIKIAAEDTKFGLEFKEAEQVLNLPDYKKFKNIRITGLMGMATFTENQDQVRKEFRSLKIFFDHLKTEYFADRPYFRELSIGMSGDYEIALQEGSTMVRIGSLIFGPR